MTSLLSYLWPWSERGLIARLAAREVHARHRQSWLGLAWLVLTPLAMLSIYTLVFRHVMRVRWHGLDEGNLAFGLRIYAGLAVFSFFAECVNRAPGLVLEQPNLVKKVVFPLHILPWVSAASAALGLAVSGVLLLGLALLAKGGLPLSALALPLVWLPLVPLVLGLSWLLTGLGTYVRDVGQVLGMAVSALMFLSPIFFPVEALPAAVRPWFRPPPASLAPANPSVPAGAGIRTQRSGRPWPGAAAPPPPAAGWRPRR